MQKLLWPMALMALLLSARPSFACDVPFIRPVQEIVARAEVIVRARAVAEHNTAAPASSEISPSSRQVEFSIIAMLKGTLNDRTMRVPGYLEDKDDWNPDTRLTLPRPGSTLTCHAVNYRRGADYLLLLGHTPQTNSLTPYWVPLARTNEQVRGDDDPWLLWVIRELGLLAR